MQQWCHTVSSRGTKRVGRRVGSRELTRDVSALRSPHKTSSNSVDERSFVRVDVSRSRRRVIFLFTIELSLEIYVRQNLRLLFSEL